MLFRIIFTILMLSLISSSAPAATLEARTAFQRGYKLIEDGEYYASINSFKETIKDPAYPLNDYAYCYIADAYQKSGNFNYAVQVYEIVVKYFGSSVLLPKALLNLSYCQSELDNYPAAIIALNSLIVKYPSHELIPEARYLLGKNLEADGKAIEAARVYRNLDLLSPESDFADKALDRLDQMAKETSLAGYEAPAATIFNLGVKRFKAGNYSKAKGYFTRLTRDFKKSTVCDDALIMLGRISLREDNLKKAEKYFKQAAALDQDSKPEAMFYLALTYDYLDSPMAAIEKLVEVASKYPSHHIADDAYYYLGRFYRENDYPGYALRSFENLVILYPNSDYFSEALWMVGNAYYKEGNYQKAYAYLNKAFSLPPEKSSDRIIFWMGKCAEKLGDRTNAVYAYKSTVARYDHSYYAYRAREELKKFGIQLEASAVPDVSEVVSSISGNSPETVSHEEKYRELLETGLGDEAAEEASFIEEKVPLPKKDTAQIAKYHAYVMKGKFAKPIYYAEKKIEEAMCAGNLSQVNPRLWRFSYPRGYWQLVEKYSEAYGLDPFLAYAVIREESRFKYSAVSRASARGLMQIMPATGRKLARSLGMRYSRSRLYTPNVNIQMGTYFLSQLIKRFDGNVSLALAGYNGGPGRVSKWLKKYPAENFDIDEFVEDIPLRETRNYVKIVLRSYYGYKRTYPNG